MTLDYQKVCQAWDPWQGIPDFYNLGAALTHGQVAQGKGQHLALLWENASGQTRSFTYSQLDRLSSKLASSLDRLGLKRRRPVFLGLPNVPEFYLGGLVGAKLAGIFVPFSHPFQAAE